MPHHVRTMHQVRDIFQALGSSLFTQIRIAARACRMQCQKLSQTVPNCSIQRCFST